MSPNDASTARPVAIFVPGVVMPANVSFGPVIDLVQHAVRPLLKELELYQPGTDLDSYGLEQEVLGIKRLADEAGAERFHLIGYSAGGAASLAFAARHGERLLSLALVEPAWTGNREWTTAEQEYWDSMDTVAEAPPEERLDRFVRLNSRPDVQSSPFGGPQPDWMAARPEGVRTILSAFRAYDLNLRTLERLTAPVYLALGGRSHPIERLKADRLARALPQLEIDEYAERHHFDPPHRAEPERFANALLRLWAAAGSIQDQEVRS